MKRTAKATLPFKMAWLSARITVAYFEYVSGTSRPGLSIWCRNIVRRVASPVCEAIYSFLTDIFDVSTMKQAALRIRLLEREILTLYTNRQASPGDVDEYDKTHAEVKL